MTMYTKISKRMSVNSKSSRIVLVGNIISHANQAPAKCQNLREFEVQECFMFGNQQLAATVESGESSQSGVTM